MAIALQYMSAVLLIQPTTVCLTKYFTPRIIYNESFFFLLQIHVEMYMGEGINGRNDSTKNVLTDSG